MAILLPMNMTLSKRGDYVVRSALALARAYPSGEPRKIREVVAEMGVPQTFASQILADLVRAGLATSKAGKGGGYRLARPPEQIPLVEVVEAGEGPLRAERCALGEGPCRWDRVCPLHETWRAATDGLRQVLGATTLADMAARDIEIEQGRAVAPPDSHRHGGTSLSVDDFVHIEASCTTVADRLRRGELAGDAITAAYLQADQLRGELLPHSLPWCPVEVTASCFPAPGSAPHSHPARTAGDAPPTAPGSSCITLDLAFEATGPAGPAGSDSHGELALHITALDPQRTELLATGHLRLPSLYARGADPEASSDPEMPSRLAQVLLRTLLRRLAATLEGPLLLQAAGGSAPTATRPASAPSSTPAGRRGRSTSARRAVAR